MTDTLDRDRHVAQQAFVSFASVDLEQLNARAALQTRVDRKYLVDHSTLAHLEQELQGAARVLEVEGRRAFGYESTYFDTPGFDCYLDAVRSRPQRFKVRTRSYLDSGAQFVEVKTRQGGRTAKVRQPGTFDDHLALTEHSAAFVRATLDREVQRRPGTATAAAQVPALRACLGTRYERTTLLVGPTIRGAVTATGPTRATIDTALAFTAPGHRSRFHPDLVLVETKTGGSPSPADRALWAAGHRPIKISKYGVGMALFHPDLPAAKWNRVLRHRFGWQPAGRAEPDRLVAAGPPGRNRGPTPSQLSGDSQDQAVHWEP